MTRADSKDAIVLSVLALLGEDQRLSYDAVAKRAGVSRQTVYTHFPTRADLLLAAVERAREDAGVEVATQSVYEAPTATAALDALVDVHVSFVPPILRAYIAVERERSMDPEVEAAFGTRTGGRRSLALHVATRLQAEGDLATPWDVDTACDLIYALTSGAFTVQLLRDAQWSPIELRVRLLVTLRRTLLNHPTMEEA
jgi:AcrR family transcriptional regulator